MARPRKPGSAQVGPEQIVERTLNQIAVGVNERNTRNARFDAAYDVWRGEYTQTEAQRREMLRSGQSRMRVKYGMQVIDQALVNLVQGVPQAKVTPRTPMAEGKADAVKKWLDYCSDLAHLGEREPVVCQMALIYGLSPAKISWCYTEDASGRPVEDRPEFEPWDPYAFMWDPVAPTVQECAYIVMEAWKTRDELESKRYDPDTQSGQYQNLDLLYQSGDGGEPKQTAQSRLSPTPAGAYKGRFKIWEVWRRQGGGIRCTVIGNEKVLLKDGPSPYRMNLYPVTVSNSRPDLFRIEGVSEAELVDHLQQAQWTLENLRMEQLKATVMRAMSIRATVPDVDSIVMRPNAKWVVNDHDDIMFHAPQPLPPEAYTEDQTNLAKMQLVTGITPYVGGASGSTSGVDQNTATGVSLLTESASRLLNFKARQISERTWQRTFQMWAELGKQYVKRDMAIRVAGPGGDVAWATVGPGDLQNDYDIRIEAGEDSALTSRERADAIALLNALFPYVQLGVVDSKTLVERVGKAFGISDPTVLLAKAPPAPPVAAPNGGLNGNGGGRPLLLGTGMGGQDHLAAQPPLSVLAGNQ